MKAIPLYNGIILFSEISQELETLNNLYITTKKSLDEKELKLKEIMKESHSLTSQLMEKEAKLAQLTEEKLHLEERGIEHCCLHVCWYKCNY